MALSSAFGPTNRERDGKYNETCSLMHLPEGMLTGSSEAAKRIFWIGIIGDSINKRRDCLLCEKVSERRPDNHNNELSKYHQQINTKSSTLSIIHPRQNNYRLRFRGPMRVALHAVAHCWEWVILTAGRFSIFICRRMTSCAATPRRQFSLFPVTMRMGKANRNSNEFINGVALLPSLIFIKLVPCTIPSRRLSCWTLHSFNRSNALPWILLRISYAAPGEEQS